MRRLPPAIISVLVAVACDSPTAPDSRIPPPVGTPTSIMFQPCEYDSQTIARCRVDARWGHTYASWRNITLEAQWAISAPNIVRIVAPGVLQAVAPGDADVTVSFNGRDITDTFRVFADGPPWHVSKRGEYHIYVVDGYGARLEGVLVEIIAGGNAGRAAVSDSTGSAKFAGDVVCGPITVRGTKQGYRDWIGSATRCGRAGNGQWGSETVGPVRMIAEI
jgi:hypothetical protein